MRIVIDIPEDYFRVIQRVVEMGIGSSSDKVICSGTPLPKGHGDLVTKEQVIELVEFYQTNPQHFDFVYLIDEIKNEKPIIKADKE